VVLFPDQKGSFTLNGTGGGGGGVCGAGREWGGRLLYGLTPAWAGVSRHGPTRGGVWGGGGVGGGGGRGDGRSFAWVGGLVGACFGVGGSPAWGHYRGGFLALGERGRWGPIDWGVRLGTGGQRGEGGGGGVGLPGGEDFGLGGSGGR